MSRWREHSLKHVLMFVVSDPQQLNWWLRRFAPRIVLRLSPDAVEAVSAQGFLQVRTTLSLLRHRDREVIVGIGDEPVADAAAVRRGVFGSTSVELVKPFLCMVLKRLPRSGSFIRPVVVLEGLNSLHELLNGNERDVIVQALTECGAAAAVVGSKD